MASRRGCAHASAVSPGKAHTVAVWKGISYLVIGYALPVVWGQQVSPFGVGIAVLLFGNHASRGFCICSGAGLYTEYIAETVVFIILCLRQSIVLLCYKSALAVVGIAGDILVCSVSYRDNIAESVVFIPEALPIAAAERNFCCVR